MGSEQLLVCLPQRVNRGVNAPHSAHDSAPYPTLLSRLNTFWEGIDTYRGFKNVFCLLA
jgi:hypothetical protein